jgi:diphthamide synthase (EF-2-diphthine--ammonia ligase)
LHVLRQRNEVEVVGLVTTFEEAANRVTMHGVSRELVEAQARAAGLPPWPVDVPWPCPNAEYASRLRRLIAEAREEEIGHFVFGDLYLEDIRAYRERQLAGTGILPLFPLWCAAAETPELARTMLAGGLRAILTCVDPRQLADRFVGREFDGDLLADLPASVDPCGERGEFHTFCYAGPMFGAPVPVRRGESLARDGFLVADLMIGSA